MGTTNNYIPVINCSKKIFKHSLKPKYTSKPFWLGPFGDNRRKGHDSLLTLPISTSSACRSRCHRLPCFHLLAWKMCALTRTVKNTVSEMKSKTSAVSIGQQLSPVSLTLSGLASSKFSSKYVSARSVLSRKISSPMFQLPLQYR